MARSIEIRDLPRDPRNCTGQVRQEIVKAFGRCKDRKQNLEKLGEILAAALEKCKQAYLTDFASDEELIELSEESEVEGTEEVSESTEESDTSIESDKE